MSNLEAQLDADLRFPNLAAFDAWLAQRPEGEEWEYLNGRAVRLTADGARHNLVKLAAATLLRDAVRAAALPCTVFTDGIKVALPDGSGVQPDVLLVCRPLAEIIDLPRQTDPTLVVEVTTDGMIDADKFLAYLAMSSLQALIILSVASRRCVLNLRTSPTEMLASIARGPTRHDPPGLTVDWGQAFADLDALDLSGPAPASPEAGGAE